MLCDFGWHSASAHSGSLWLYDLSQHGDTAVSGLFWLPLAARWSWHVFRPWHGKVCATLNRLQLCVTNRLPFRPEHWHFHCKKFFFFLKWQRYWSWHWIFNKKLMTFCDLYSDVVFHKYVTHIGREKNMFITSDFMQSQRKRSNFHVLVPLTVSVWGNWKWVSHGFHTGMVSRSASHLLLAVARSMRVESHFDHSIFYWQL